MAGGLAFQVDGGVERAVFAGLDVPGLAGRLATVQPQDVSSRSTVITFVHVLVMSN